MSSLLNKTATRDYAEMVMKLERPALAEKFTRVSETFFEAIEAQTRIAIINRIKAHNSSGKTLT